MIGKNQKKVEKESEKIYNQYHQKITEEALEPLYKDFIQWKSGKLPYFQLTDRIHEFHKKIKKFGRSLTLLIGMMRFS